MAASAPPPVGSRRRALTCGRQALLVLVHLRTGAPFTQAGAGFAVSTSTAWRYVHEAVDLPAVRAPKLDRALRAAREPGERALFLDGTLIPIDRVAAERPFFSGRHRRHRMNLQVLATLNGRLIWVSGALPGSVHDLRAARIWDIPWAVARAGLLTLADKGYRGAGEPVLTPCKGRAKPEVLKDANRAHARLRSPGERAIAQLKTWRILRQLRCCPHRTGHIAKAVLVLQARETHAY
ncbi:hypothetical protein HNR61_001543 [Actinomadura namibiensis]|uniref:Transposase n=1 Tax=Actinomadura namibiensis TaxID=182080 RepID=A0A7W3QK05_ACTNM|nr:hypothetical protein [Actinomadura namibiensis]